MSKHPEDRRPPGPAGETLGCEAVSRLLETYVDGDLGEAAGRRLETHVETCEACEAELLLAQRIRAGLASLPAERCPERVTAAVFARTLERRGPLERLREWLPAAPAAGPLLAFGLAAVLALGLWLAMPRQPAGPATEAPGLAATAAESSPAEVRRAEEEVKLALAYLGKINQKAGTSVSQRVLGHKAFDPLTRVLAPMLAPAAKKENDAT